MQEYLFTCVVYMSDILHHAHIYEDIGLNVKLLFGYFSFGYKTPLVISDSESYFFCVTL